MASGRMTDDRLEEVAGSVYGVRLRGRLPAAFQSYLYRGAGGPNEPELPLDVTYRVVDHLPEVEEIWSSETEGPQGELRLVLFPIADGFGLTVSGLGSGSFRCTHDVAHVEWVTPEAGAAHHFFCYALPLWLEQRGVPVLHGSAVTLDGRAVGFLGPSGIGKSVLCAELRGAGCGFLTDDGLALRRDPSGEWRCSHGPPFLRLWPSGLEGRLEIDPGSLPKVHATLEKRRLQLEQEGAIPTSVPPLAALYLLDRRPEAAGPVEILPCRPGDAVARLIEHGVAVGPAAALGLAGRRLRLLADVVERVPVRILRYPSGAESAAPILEAMAGEW